MTQQNLGMAIDENRRYVIISASDVSSVDFSQVIEVESTLRYSLDGSQTFVKYSGGQPSSIAAIQGKSQEYTHAQVFSILRNESWHIPDDDII